MLDCAWSLDDAAEVLFHRLELDMLKKQCDPRDSASWAAGTNSKNSQESLKVSPNRNTSCLKSTWLQTVGNHDLRYALCSSNDLKGGWASTSLTTPCRTASIRFWGLADFLVKQSAKHHWVLICDRSAIEPEHASFLSIWIIWMVSCCSGTWVVLAVVTRLFASVLIWISLESPVMSLISPLNIWHVP